MKKKVLATILGCFAAATIILTGTYYFGESSEKGNIIDLNEADYSDDSDVAINSENSVADETVNAKPEETTTEEVTTEKITETESATKVSEEETEDLHGLSTEANALIASLDFNEESTMLWPVEGDILLEYNMENTIYFSTLDEYKTNPAIVIQADEDLPVVAAATGVVSEIGEDSEIGVYLKTLIGNDYELTYGQIINPTIEVGDTVEEGMVIGYINEPTNYYAKEGYNLYFKVMCNDEPVDPLDYLSYD